MILVPRSESNNRRKQRRSAKGKRRFRQEQNNLETVPARRLYVVRAPYPPYMITLAKSGRRTRYDACGDNSFGRRILSLVPPAPADFCPACIWHGIGDEIWSTPRRYLRRRTRSRAGLFERPPAEPAPPGARRSSHSRRTKTRPIHLIIRPARAVTRFRAGCRAFDTLRVSDIRARDSTRAGPPWALLNAVLTDVDRFSDFHGKPSAGRYTRPTPFRRDLLHRADGKYRGNGLPVVSGYSILRGVPASPTVD